MKRVWIVGWIVGVLLGASDGCKSHHGCKMRLVCDYYVAQKGDQSHQKSCLIFAQSIDVDGARATAAWYYLLGGAPQKALQKAQLAIKQGHQYAAFYAAAAALVLGDLRLAMHFIHRSHDQKDTMVKERQVLQRLYPAVDFSQL